MRQPSVPRPAPPGPPEPPRRIRRADWCSGRRAGPSASAARLSVGGTRLRDCSPSAWPSRRAGRQAPTDRGAAAPAEAELHAHASGAAHQVEEIRRQAVTEQLDRTPAVGFSARCWPTSLASPRRLLTQRPGARPTIPSRLAQLFARLPEGLTDAAPDAVTCSSPSGRETVLSRPSALPPADRGRRGVQRLVNMLQLTVSLYMIRCSTGAVHPQHGHALLLT